MYKISTRGQYALLIMEDLAENAEDSFVPLRLLSHRRNLSVKYLEQILSKLVAANLVEGSRGINGGYRLTKPADNYTAGEILRVMEGDLSPRNTNEGNTIESAGSDEFWKGFENVINNFVDSITLDTLVHKNKEFVGFEYCI
ncbi:Rrf2 family transcriptional regulator [uncultured Treponema sp.]|uniref:RrF2 family transcriptional regulator n=1 Tax=uncultured Treponema sp. TaxID=162155 RepID=UPI0025CC311E|nr:Rrf2 family transcriptional regulator [uncultured Treponema sp.]